MTAPVSAAAPVARATSVVVVVRALTGVGGDTKVTVSGRVTTRLVVAVVRPYPPAGSAASTASMTQEPADR